MASTYTEPIRAGEFLISEGGGTRSREKVTIKSGEDLLAGAVVGKITVGAATAAAVAGNTGNGTCGAVTLSAGAKAGVYRLVIIEPATNAGAFVVEDPDGIIIGRGNVASAFSDGGLAFTLADGSTDFVAGDSFTITIAAGSGKYVEMDPAATDGSQIAAGVLYGDCDAAAADKEAVIIARDAEVNEALLVWISGATTNQKNAGKAQLATLGIIARAGFPA